MMSQSPLKFHGQPITQHLIAGTAGLLDAHKIPNVLWGNIMLIVHGVPSLTEVCFTYCSMNTDPS